MVEAISPRYICTAFPDYTAHNCSQSLAHCRRVSRILCDFGLFVPPKFGFWCFTVFDRLQPLAAIVSFFFLPALLVFAVQILNLDNG